MFFTKIIKDLSAKLVLIKAEYPIILADIKGLHEKVDRLENMFSVHYPSRF